MDEYSFDDPWHGEELTRLLDPDQPFRPGFDRCLSITRAGKLIGGVLYDNFLKRSIHMHVASMDKSWLTRDFLFRAFSYPFYTCGVEVIYAPVQSTNEHALQFDKRIGFEEEIRLIGAIPDGDLVILSMRIHQCRWLDRKPRVH